MPLPDPVRTATLSYDAVALVAALVASFKPAEILPLVSASFSLAASAFVPVMVLGIFWAGTTPAGFLGRTDFPGFVVEVLAGRGLVEREPGRVQERPIEPDRLAADPHLGERAAGLRHGREPVDEVVAVGVRRQGADPLDGL